MENKKPIGAYKALNSTGWAAYDEKGRTWPITAEEASELPQVKSYPELAKERGL